MDSFEQVIVDAIPDEATVEDTLEVIKDDVEENGEIMDWQEQVNEDGEVEFLVKSTAADIRDILEAKNLKIKDEDYLESGEADDYYDKDEDYDDIDRAA